ncbi:FlgB family protein [Seohaeicola saemankumensis]|nr:FlgB family protein [Seohaeicola saemankumensis]MCA0870509.1 FlgB family protein [Seohaeicola saemankumensis]
MFTDLNVFQVAHAMAAHAGHRQALVSRNIANADTPGYTVRDIEPFASAFETDSGSLAAKGSRLGHFGQSSSFGGLWAEITPDTPADPNGNSVSVEEEMFKAVEVKRQHDRALAIYRSSLNILRTSLGRS